MTKIALCDASGLLKNLLDNLSGKSSAEWLEILRRTLRRENPFKDETVAYSFHLTPSLLAGVTALEELCEQEHISTATWLNIEVGPIDNNRNYSNAFRWLAFTLKDGKRVEVKVNTWKKEPRIVVETDENHGWEPAHVFVEIDWGMRSFVDSHRTREVHPWCRWPDSDKPLPGERWRLPSPDEVENLKAAAIAQDKDQFLRVYHHNGPIDWREVMSSDLGKSIYWAQVTLGRPES